MKDCIKPTKRDFCEHLFQRTPQVPVLIILFLMELTENHKIKIEKFENTIIGHLNITSLKSKFILAQTFIRDCNIFLISVM